MQKQTNIVKKRFFTAITIVLLIAIIIPMTALPIGTAHSPAWQIPTFAYIETPINPVGVGQTAYVYMWLDKTISGALMASNNVRFHNFKLTITAPDGTVSTKTWDVVQDTTSSQSYIFSPDQVGIYNFTFDFPGQVYTYNTVNTPGLAAASAVYENDTYLASSASCTLTVTQEPTTSATGGIPMPIEYWTRPIFGENDQWWTITSNWLGNSGSANQGYGNVYQGDAIGSQTSHIMWTKSIQDGGVVGGDQFEIQGVTYFEGTAYNNRYTNPIILAGKIYYTDPVSFPGASAGATVCVDLRTGQEYWRRSDVPALTFGLVWDVQTPNQHGTYPPILVQRITNGTGYNWRAFDAYTGNFLFNATGVPSGTTEVGANGEYLIYTITNYGTTAKPDYHLLRWNSTKLWTFGNSPAIATTVDASTKDRYDFNVSIPFTGSTAPSVLIANWTDTAICRSGAYPSIGGTSYSWTYLALNLNQNSGTIGSVIWTNTVNAPSGNQSITYSGADYSARVFVEKYKESMQYKGYSMDTGKELWTTDGKQDALNYYASGYNAGGNQNGASYAYGKLYVSGMSGILYCYSLTDGKLLWSFGNGSGDNSTYSGQQVPGYYPITLYAIGNGVVYTTVSEHTIETPPYKGAMNLAINATDGTLVWKVRAMSQESGAPFTGAMADGYNTFLNGYTNQIYVLGRGSSKTSVEGPTLSVTSGSSVVIQGTVTDTSSGTTQTEQAARFPDGVPVASDASMTEWMAYVYQQAAKPTNYTGVPVTINVVDSNGNYRTIGTATTDATGRYKLIWKPDIEGDYSVYAVFAGSNAYWGSTASTVFNVDPAPTTATPQPTQAPSMADLYFLPMSAALFITMIVIGLLVIVMLRKRP